MKKALIKKGMELVLCKSQGGPINPTARWRGKGDYCKAVVLDPDHKAISSYQHSAEAKEAYKKSGWAQVHGSNTDGILVEVERPYRGYEKDMRGTKVKSREVVKPQHLYDMKVADVDAIYEERKRQEAESKDNLRAKNEAEVARQQALVERVRVLGIDPGPDFDQPRMYPDGTKHDWEPSLTVVEALVALAETLHEDMWGKKPARPPFEPNESDIAAMADKDFR